MMNIVRPLLLAAGGEYRPDYHGTLYKYWFELAIELEVITGHQVTVRTLEVAWREKKLSRQLKQALLQLAQKRAAKNDHQFIEGVGKWIDWFARDAPVSAKEVVIQARLLLPALHRLASFRGRIAVSQTLVELAEENERDRTTETVE